MIDTMIKITDTISGRKVCDLLYDDMRTINYNPDLIKLHKNFSNMITELSKLEVKARTSPTKRFLQQPLQELNDAATNLSSIILMAKLMQ